MLDYFISRQNNSTLKTALSVMMSLRSTRKEIQLFTALYYFVGMVLDGTLSNDSYIRILLITLTDRYLYDYIQVEEIKLDI